VRRTAREDREQAVDSLRVLEMLVEDDIDTTVQDVRNAWIRALLASAFCMMDNLLGCLMRNAASC
jgi:hypothetical protein